MPHWSKRWNVDAFFFILSGIKCVIDIMAGHGMIDRAIYSIHLGDKRASLLLNGLPKGTPRAQNVSQLFEPILNSAKMASHSIRVYHYSFTPTPSCLRHLPRSGQPSGKYVDQRAHGRLYLPPQYYPSRGFKERYDQYPSSKLKITNT